MNKQSYSNHARYYIPHHLIFYSLILIGSIVSVSSYFKQKDCSWLLVAALFVIVGWLSFMLRQHYALTLQDRIIRQEVRFRYYTLTGQRFEVFESRLSLSQILALRFASDEELPDLIKKILAENLSPKTIKQSILNWQGDYMRV